MLFNYLTIILESLSHVFRAIGACVILLPISYFAIQAAFDLCNGLSVVLGIISIASAVLAVAFTYDELEQMAKKVRAFKRWSASIQNV